MGDLKRASVMCGTGGFFVGVDAKGCERGIDIAGERAKFGEVSTPHHITRGRRASGKNPMPRKFISTGSGERIVASAAQIEARIFRSSEGFGRIADMSDEFQRHVHSFRTSPSNGTGFAIRARCRLQRLHSFLNCPARFFREIQRHEEPQISASARLSGGRKQKIPSHRVQSALRSEQADTLAVA